MPFWEKLVAEAETSGSIEDVARRHGVKSNALRWWRWRIRRGTVARSATKTKPVQMIPVRVRERKVVAAPDDLVEVVVRGAIVRVRIGHDVRYVAELASALAARC
jgi:transposase-like protein